MPKQYTADGLSGHITNRYEVDNYGDITAIHVTVSVNYGTMGRVENIDIWPTLTQNQKDAAQSIYNVEMSLLRKIILD